ncbi:O-methyltransferase [Ornithinimicrobium kibberense]|uniref:O-methyltransferase n=1 Tax=Ornithinimicrobium kibberense TaxID=282060 RepID=UPI00360BA3C3
MEQARRRGEELGVPPVSDATGAALRLLAAAVGARHVVEVGTGAGSSGLWLLQGMPHDGILTSIDVEPEHQRAARAAFSEAGIPPQRTRVIGGDAVQVMGRLTDGAYDLVLVDADEESYPAYVDQAVRLLRVGGVLAVHGMLGHDKVADPASRDTVTTLLRDLGKALRDDDRLLPALLPVGDGLLVAVRR